MERLYCPECGNYLEGGDGSMVDCHCGWKQERSLSSDEDEIEQLRQRVQELEQQLTEVRRAERERVAKMVRDCMFKIGQSSPYRELVSELLDAIRAME